MQLAPNVHLMPWILAYTYVITEPGELTLIDTGYPYHADLILSFIGRLGYRPSDLKRIVITHADIDHVGSLAQIHTATGARVCASPIEAEAIVHGQVSRPVGGIARMRKTIQAVTSLAHPRPCPVDEVLTGGMVLPLLGGLAVIDTPGHTPGHISLWSPAQKILFPGDSFVIYRESFQPYQDWNVWNVDQAIASFERQAGLHPALICGGHRWTNRRIEERFARGLDQINKQEGLQ